MADARYWLADEEDLARLRSIVSPVEAEGPSPAAARQHDLDELFAAQKKPGRGGDPAYVKIRSHGVVGYLPKANLQAAKAIDKDLQVLDG